MHTLKVAIAGFGGVGRTTAQLLLSRQDHYRQRYGVDVRLVAVCGSKAGLVATDGLRDSQLQALQADLTGPAFIASSGADLLIEAGPSDFRSGGPGLPYLQSALAAGKDCIVISKGALVHSGRQLRELAKASGATLKLSGATAAALPTLDLVGHSLAGCKVLSVDGILNATTNFLLDSMGAHGLGFDEALRLARENGFAEADPRNDTEGWDTACKLLLLANFGLGADLTMDDLEVDGIHSVTPELSEGWRAQGLVPKLVGSLSYEDGKVRASVGIKTYPISDPFAHVRGKNKAIRIHSDAMGETVAIGGGAEPLATAAAALKDLEHILMAKYA
ncbi:homoserine dehydrogenase [Pseudomonas sp. LS_2]|uniref:homoserine dehydrogenase n=1 Tax=Pseudomonas sp. LS_2 TaxID=3055789 RepID=UPI003656D3B1